LPKLQVAGVESPAFIQRRAIGKPALYDFSLSGWNFSALQTSGESRSEPTASATLPKGPVAGQSGIGA
jgi:hypothetical protein